MAGNQRELTALPSLSVRRGCSVTAACIAILLASPSLADTAADAAPARSSNCLVLVDVAIPAPEISLPSDGAVVTAAQLVGPGTPGEYCQLNGEIRHLDPDAWPVLFQVNLPTNWNGKMVQFGGGGLNGRLITGLDLHRDAPPGPTALERGFVTGGTDAGHPATPEIQEFALNDEALHNHAYAAYRKTYDVMLLLASRYYGQAPRLSYFYGGSEGGREGLLMAQRYPDLFDGIVSVVPVLDWVGVNLAGYNQFLLHRTGGAMSPEHVALWQQAVEEACDAADGLSDGLIARYAGCDEMPAIVSRRCVDGADGEGCFSDAQIALIRAYASPYEYGVELSDGMTSLPRYGLGGEAHPGNVIPMVVNAPGRPDNEVGFPRYSSGDVRYFIARDPAFVGAVDMATYGGRAREISALMDMSDTDLSAFRAAGGKLIMRSNTADALVPPGSVWRYYDGLRERFGDQTDEFAVLYMAPGGSHGGDGRLGDGRQLPNRYDLLAALDHWVEHDVLPADPVLGSYPEGASVPEATLPLCRYPEYPHYSGQGDPQLADSYRCTPLQP